MATSSDWFERIINDISTQQQILTMSASDETYMHEKILQEANDEYNELKHLVGSQSRSAKRPASSCCQYGKYIPSSAVTVTESLPVVGHISRVNVPESSGETLETSAGSSTLKPLKDVHISGKLVEEFMVLAKSNTEKDLETCGILGASLENQIYYVTTLIIPKQETTSNSCQALNEEEILDVLGKQSLFPLGWIHTHPSQSCFLSSIDLHTQYSYQLMLPEAVAIVMAPTDTTRSCGFFRLTDPGGIDVLRECPDRGFHPHRETSDGSPIYECCTHVCVNPNLRFEIVDLRSTSASV